MFKRTMLFAGTCALCIGASFYPARAADAVIEEDPAPPEPVIEAQVSDQNWYIAARIGAAFAEDTQFSTLGTTVDTEYDPGYNLAMAVGYTFRTDSPISFRTEAELGYMVLEADQHQVAGLGTFSGGAADGEASAIVGLANAYVDYELGTFTPFVSAGIGYANLELDNFGTTPTGQVLDTDGDGVAWQIGVGTAYAVSDTLNIDLGYRYSGIEDVSVTAVDGTSSDLDFRNHQVTIGIRKAF